MTVIKLLVAASLGLATFGVPLVASAQTLEAAPMAPHAAPMYSGRSVHKMMKRKRPSTGSSTNGKPDGANTGSRKQTPTGGNPGNSDHS